MVGRLEVYCPLTKCRKKYRGSAVSVITRLHSHLVHDHQILKTPGTTCPVCKVKYCNQGYMRVHLQKHLQPMKMFHSGRRNWLPYRKQEFIKYYKCKKCCKTFSSRCDMKMHILHHIRPPKDAFCEEFYARNLKRVDTAMETEYMTCIQKELYKGNRNSMVGYSIFNHIGPEGTGYKVHKRPDSTIKIELHPRMCRNMAIADVFFTNENHEMVSASNARQIPELDAEDDVISLHSDTDTISTTEASASDDSDIVIVETNEKDEQMKISTPDKGSVQKLKRNEYSTKGNKTMESCAEIASDDEIEELKEDQDPSQDDVIAEIEQYIADEGLDVTEL